MTGAMTVSILVGGKMQSEIPIKLSEVWHMEDTGKERKITTHTIYSVSNNKQLLYYGAVQVVEI